jgi:hypothetical protein
MAQLIDIDMSVLTEGNTVSKLMGYVPSHSGNDTVSTLASAFKTARQQTSEVQVGTSSQSSVANSIGTEASVAATSSSRKTQNSNNTSATTNSTRRKRTVLEQGLAGLINQLEAGSLTDIHNIRQQLEVEQVKTHTGTTEARSTGEFSC